MPRAQVEDEPSGEVPVNGLIIEGVDAHRAQLETHTDSTLLTERLDATGCLDCHPRIVDITLLVPRAPHADQEVRHRASPAAKVRRGSHPASPSFVALGPPMA